MLAQDSNKTGSAFVCRWRGIKTSPSFFLRLSLLIAAFVAIAFFQTDFTRTDSSPNKINLDSKIVPHVVLGFKLLAADMLWIRLLQDVDYKENVKVITRGWAFSMFDTITTLDARFLFAYRLGGVILGILVHDAEGAAIIFERAVRNYPHDWSLSYQAGYHFMANVKDCAKAAKYLNQAADNGAPPWVHSLAGRLYMKAGQYELAKSVIVNAINAHPDDFFRPQLEKRLQELEEANRDNQTGSLFKGLNCEAK